MTAIQYTGLNNLIDKLRDEARFTGHEESALELLDRWLDLLETFDEWEPEDATAEKLASWLEARNDIRAQARAMWKEIGGRIVTPTTKAMVRRMVADGKLVRYGKGKLIEADKYDPNIHGPKDAG